MERLLALIPPDVTRIDLLAPPFAGHLHPVLAMGRALSTHYQVRIISTEGARTRIEAAGLTALLLPGDYDSPLTAVVNPRYAVKSNPLRLYRQFKRVVGLLKNFADELAGVWLQQGKPDLAIADFTLPVVGEVCRRLVIPWWTSMPSPCVIDTPDGVPAYSGGLLPPVNTLQRFTQTLHRHKVRGFKRLLFRLFRQTIRQTGIYELYRQDGSENAYSPDCILALGEAWFEFPRSWPVAVRFIGPALYTPPLTTTAPPFVAGKRHVLVTLGTHLDWHKEAVVQAVHQLAQTLPDWMFHFTDGDMAAGSVTGQKNVVRLPWVDYDCWLAHYDAVIHHGGAGILWHCLQREIPSLVYPVDYDQFDHAARLHHCGKGIWLRGGVQSIAGAKAALQRVVEGKEA